MNTDPVELKIHCTTRIQHATEVASQFLLLLCDVTFAVDKASPTTGLNGL